MKKALVLALAVTVLAVFASCGAGEPYDPTSMGYSESTLNMDYSQYAGTTLQVFNWGYYISDGSDGTINVNEEFEKLTGINVEYTTYDSNEKMYAKLSGGGGDYDVVIPSDYMIGRLIEEDYLAELNFDNIPNYRYISDAYKNTEYDPDNKFSVPYSVGMVGVIYNTSVVEGTPDSWSLMWDERYADKILNFGNSRDAFATAQFCLGIDINTTDKAEWDTAFDKLVEQKDILQGYVMDEIFNKMESGEAAIAPYYAGDFFTMYGNNDDLAFYYPKEGTNVFIDAACVLKNSDNIGAAELYINFLMDPVIAQANAEYIYYASPNTAVVENEDYIEYLEELHPDAYDILYGIDDGYNAVSFKNLDQSTKEYLNKKWDELRSDTSDGSDTSIFIISGVVIAALLVFFIAKAFIKKKREADEEE